jgi:hypothetical protein
MSVNAGKSGTETRLIMTIFWIQFSLFSHLGVITFKYQLTDDNGRKNYGNCISDQRVTAFFVYLLVGLSILISPVLKIIPTSCLFGIFLYMGTYSLHGIQFWDRLNLMLMPVKYHPHVEYVKRVSVISSFFITNCTLIRLSISSTF